MTDWTLEDAERSNARIERGEPADEVAEADARPFVVGIDPGVQTGFAVYVPARDKLDICTSMGFWEAIAEVKRLHKMGVLGLVVVEDTRGLTIYDRHRRRQLSRSVFSRLCRSVGAIDKECDVWEDWLRLHGIPHLMAEPGKGAKWDARRFKQITGFDGKTNCHARDAARICWGRNP